MNYWIFKANPEKYNIDGRLLDPDSNIIWKVTRYQDRIQKGILFLSGEREKIVGSARL